jgi:phospholipid-binding lipoprotein MlaA
MPPAPLSHEQDNQIKALFLLPALVAWAALLSGCASGDPLDERDPLERTNREVGKANKAFDRVALQPAAKAYAHTTPRLVRVGVSNFFANLRDPWSAANSLAQLKPADAAQDTTRFAVNTVFGLAGVLDIATDAGIERHKQDFGTTLAVWGVPAGPYIVLPLLGPSTLRDTLALPVDWLGDPLSYVSPVVEHNALLAGTAVDTRARLLAMDPVLDGAFDRYTMMRDGYLQHRTAQMHGAAHGGLPQDGHTDAGPQEAPSVEPAAGISALPPRGMD